jgi:hypothetical protein
MIICGVFTWILKRHLKQVIAAPFILMSLDDFISDEDNDMKKPPEDKDSWKLEEPGKPGWESYVQSNTESFDSTSGDNEWLTIFIEMSGEVYIASDEYVKLEDKE